MYEARGSDVACPADLVRFSRMPGGRAISAKGAAREVLGTTKLVGWSCGSGTGVEGAWVAMKGCAVMAGAVENGAKVCGAVVYGAVVYDAVVYGAVVNCVGA